MPRFMLMHQHAADECGIAFAAWKGFDSPLRHGPVTSSCRDGGHSLWWEVEADDQLAALAQLPPYLAERTRAVRVREVMVP